MQAPSSGITLALPCSNQFAGPLSATAPPKEHYSFDRSDSPAKRTVARQLHATECG
jgi:hypothetical protein